MNYILTWMYVPIEAFMPVYKLRMFCESLKRDKLE